MSTAKLPAPFPPVFVVAAALGAAELLEAPPDVGAAGAFPNTPPAMFTGVPLLLTPFAADW
jgi:hypothetical protein